MVIGVLGVLGKVQVLNTQMNVVNIPNVVDTVQYFGKEEVTPWGPNQCSSRKQLVYPDPPGSPPSSSWTSPSEETWPCLMFNTFLPNSLSRLLDDCFTYSMRLVCGLHDEGSRGTVSELRIVSLLYR